LLDFLFRAPSRIAKEKLRILLNKRCGVLGIVISLGSQQ
jgi:hypothetical protein